MQGAREVDPEAQLLQQLLRESSLNDSEHIYESFQKNKTCTGQILQQGGKFVIVTERLYHKNDPKDLIRENTSKST